MDKTAPILIVYDGECPFCSQYVKMLRLKEAVGDVTLVNARDEDPSVRMLREAGYDLNEGMALIDGDQVYFGDACMHRLALMSTSSGFFNRANAFIFRHRKLARFLYPLLRGGRSLTLRMMGRNPI